MNRLAGRDQGGAPHVIVISQRRGLAWDLVRRMSAHQGFSFRHEDMDSVDSGSVNTGTRDTREAGNITFLSLQTRTHDTRFNETLTLTLHS